MVFFHQRLVLRLHEPDEEEVDDLVDGFIQEGVDNLGQDSDGAFHCGLGSDGHSHELEVPLSILGMEVSGAGVTGLPEKSAYLLEEVVVLLPIPIPRGFHQGFVIVS